MCHSCWYGYPVAEVTPEVREAAAAVAALYERHPTGGAMHVATDDWNIEDDSIEFCGNNLPSEPRHEPYVLDEVETACYEAMRRLSVDQRAAALAIFDGYFSPSDTPLDAVTTEHLVVDRSAISWTPTGNHILGVDRDAVPFCSCGRRWLDGEDTYSEWDSHCFDYERPAGPMREPEPVSKFDVMHNEFLAEQGLPPMFPRERY